MPEPGAAVAQGAPRVVGRYAVHDEVASDELSTVHIGRLIGEGGRARTVAVRRLHPHLVKDQNFVAALFEEARAATRVHNPNIVATLDVVMSGGELFVVLAYVHGESVALLFRHAAARSERVPQRIALRIALDVLCGLHAAHEALSEDGLPLAVIHGDVSPQNILVGADGVSRVVDFGVAKAAQRVRKMQDGRETVSYASPEQLAHGEVDRRSDVYAASVVLWEMLTGRRLFAAGDEGADIRNILGGDVSPPSAVAPIDPAIDAITMRGLARSEADRFPTAREMAAAIEQLGAHASASEVAGWLKERAGDRLRRRATQIAEIENSAFDIARRASSRPPAEGAELATSAAAVSSKKGAVPFWVAMAGGAVIAAAGWAALQLPLRSKSLASAPSAVREAPGIASAAPLTEPTPPPAPSAVAASPDPTPSAAIQLSGSSKGGHSPSRVSPHPAARAASPAQP